MTDQKTDPEGGSSQRSASREAVGGLYKDIVGKQKPVKQQSDPSADAKPEGETSIHEGGADYDMPDAPTDVTEEGNTKSVDQ